MDGGSDRDSIAAVFVDAPGKGEAVAANDLQAKVETRREQAARLEQERVDLQIEIDAFRQAYLARVGPAQADLEALEVQIAEYRLRNELVRLRGDTLDAARLEAEVDWQLRGRRAQFSSYQETVHRADCDAWDEKPSLDPPTQADLKALYRNLAKRAHPDLAIDESDRAARSNLMAEINTAYARSDLSALKSLLAQVQHAFAPEPMQTAERLQVELDRLERVIAAARAEIAELNHSDWMALKLDAALARSRGIDWFGRARREIELKTVDRRKELKGLIVEFMELVREAGLG